MLWRSASSPASSHPLPYDVPAGHYAGAGVAWLAHFGITTGVGGSNTFQPSGPVTRGQLATFLHRLVATPSAMGPSAVVLAVGP